MRRAAIAAATIGIAIIGVLVGLVVSGAIGQEGGEVPPVKQTIEASETAAQATAEAGPHAPKPTGQSSPIPTPQSCPIDPTRYRTVIASPPAYGAPPSQLFPGIFGSRDNRRINVVSQALGLTTQGAPYTIWSGALASDPHQGVIVVWLGAKDPCAEGRSSYPPQEYLTPLKAGAVTLTQIDGDMVVFQTGDGTTGSLNYVTGTFITTTPSATAVPTGSETPVAGQ